MKLASLKGATRDGRLVVVSRDLTGAVDASKIAPTLQQAVERWAEVEAPLTALYDRLNAGTAADALAFNTREALAPLPRCHQFIDASAFRNHGMLMEKAYNLVVKNETGAPILGQRQSDDFRGACQDFEFPEEADNCDFEGEFAVIVDDIPMGADAQKAQSHVRLITILNDVSLRAHLFRELSLGFGFIQAKPATVFGPVAVTPDELGEAWSGGRVHLDMNVHRNGEWFGNPNGGEMDWSFGELLARIAYSRNIRAGSILGSGTVSNRDYKKVGSACLAERRAVETIETGNATTPFLKFGETLRFEVFGPNRQPLFGAIEQRHVRRA